MEELMRSFIGVNHINDVVKQAEALNVNQSVLFKQAQI